jgi:hypothetical protein
MGVIYTIIASIDSITDVLTARQASKHPILVGDLDVSTCTHIPHVHMHFNLEQSQDARSRPPRPRRFVAMAWLPDFSRWSRTIDRHPGLVDPTTFLSVNTQQLNERPESPEPPEHNSSMARCLILV